MAVRGFFYNATDLNDKVPQVIIFLVGEIHVRFGFSFKVFKYLVFV